MHHSNPSRGSQNRILSSRVAVSSRYQHLRHAAVPDDAEHPLRPTRATKHTIDGGEDFSHCLDNTEKTTKNWFQDERIFRSRIPPPSSRGKSVSRAHVLTRMATATAVTSLYLLFFRPSTAQATTKDPKTGILLPDPGEIESSIPKDWTDIENPISTSDPSQLFGRLDKQPDSIFYSTPRFVEHVDDNAVSLMTEYISKTAIQQPRDVDVLDLCSSWTSHIDPTVARTLRRVSGLGMNEQELEKNPVLTDWTVQDLNTDPRLVKYEDGSFDVVLCQLSIDYLTKPLEVLKEVGRVLRPGGTVQILFSNRLFLTKAVGLWTGGDDIDHAYYVGCYLHFCNGGFIDIKGRDLSTRRGGRDNRIVGDPLFVVTAVKG